MRNEKIETVGLREFSKAVSAYVRKASLGVRILITDRGKVIAEISKAALRHFREGHPLLREWEEAGRIRPASGQRASFPRGKALMPAPDFDRLLNETRE